MKTIKKVEEFTNAFEINYPKKPNLEKEKGLLYEFLDGAATQMENLSKVLHHAAVICNGDPKLLRLQLIQEELAELARGMCNGDPVECLDALVDLRYVCDGGVLILGLQDVFEEAFDEVHRSNMSKLEDGRPVKNAAGRVVKGKDYSPPELKGILCKSLGERL